MRVECPNCSTEYEVPQVHFLDGGRKLRCTECGYRWNQTLSEVDLDEGRKSTPLLDMMEPALDIEPALSVDLPEPTEAQLGASTMAQTNTPESADRAYQEIDEALSPLPSYRSDEPDQETGRRWQWGLGIVALALLATGLGLGREAVVKAAPFTQPIYRAVGIEPWSTLRDWNLCLASVSDDGLSYHLTNTSDFRRAMPFLAIVQSSNESLELPRAFEPFSGGEAVKTEVDLSGMTLDANPQLRLAVDAQGLGAKTFGAC